MPRLTTLRKRAVDEMMREAIFEAAVSVLAEFGVEGMTMERVALAAGLAKGSLYHYFSGKQAILELVHTKLIDSIFHQLQEIVTTERPAVEKLSLHLEQLLKHVAQNLHVFKLLYQNDVAQGLLQASQRRCREAGSQLLALIFRQGIEEGVFRSADPLMLTAMFQGLCRGVFDSQPELDSPQQQNQIRELILTTFLHGIAAREYRPH